MAAVNGETDDGAMCRICYLEEAENSLIRVCECKGSLQYVHHSCINDWVNKSRIVNCMCGYRLSVRQEKLKIKIPLKELYEKSMREFQEELTEEDIKKRYYILGPCTVITVLSMLLLLSPLFELLVTGDIQVMDHLLLTSFAGFPLVSYCNMMIYLSFIVIITFIALICVRVLRKMWRNRCVEKLTVKPLE